MLLSLLHLVILLLVSVVIADRRWIPTLRPNYGQGLVKPPLHDLRRLQARADAGNNTLGITTLALSADKQSYFALINIGAVSLRVAIDTASSDLLVVSSDCKTDTCNTVPKYPLSYKSDSFIAINDNATLFNVSYADTTAASGFIATEKVEIANLTVVDQTFGLVQSSNFTRQDSVSGILGLGFPRLSTLGGSVVNGTPFAAKLSQQGRLAYPLFGLSLTRNSTGTLSIGAVDSSVVTNISKIGWSEVVQFAPFGAERNASTYLQWAVPLTAFNVNGTQVAPTPTYSNIRSASIALIDIGTSGIFGPYQDVSRLFALISGSRLVDADKGQWVIPCDTTVPIQLTFGSQNYTLQPTDYIIGPAAGNPNLCLSWPRALPPSSDGIDWQLGSPFLRTVYSVFSYGINTKERPVIGLYPLGNTTELPESPDAVSSFLSSNSATVSTTLPNFVIAVPTLTTHTYAFNTSAPIVTSRVPTSGLATSTYNVAISKNKNNALLQASILPTIAPAPTQTTMVLTNSAGGVLTSVVTATFSSVALGVPPGWHVENAALVAPTISYFAIILVVTVGLFMNVLLL